MMGWFKRSYTHSVCGVLTCCLVLFRVPSVPAYWAMSRSRWETVMNTCRSSKTEHGHSRRSQEQSDPSVLIYHRLQSLINQTHTIRLSVLRCKRFFIKIFSDSLNSTKEPIHWNICLNNDVCLNSDEHLVKRPDKHSVCHKVLGSEWNNFRMFPH